MRPNLLCILLLQQVSVCLFANNNLRLADVRSMGMTGNEVVHSVLFNPALVALPTGKSVQFNYFNRYGLKELATVNGSFYYPNEALSAGFDYSSFGYDAYRESLFRLSLGKQLGRGWIVGISFQYALLQTELFEEQPACLSTDIGILYSPVDNLLIGMLIMNLPSVSIGDKSVEIEDFTFYTIQTGFQWEIINNMFISATIENNKDDVFTAGFGLEYIPFDSFSIRAGVGGKPFLPSFGVGYSFSRFTVNAAAVYHSILGISSGLGLIFSF